MNPFTFAVVCDICGEDGVGTIQTAAAAYDARSEIAHTDSRICRDNLERQRHALKKERTEFERPWALPS